MKTGNEAGKMVTRDFETELDDALTRLSYGVEPTVAPHNIPETIDLLSLARRLKILAPTPVPNLAQGRQRFMNEVAQLAQRKQQTTRRIPHPAFALVVGTVLVLIVGGLAVITLSVGSANAQTSTPVATATITVTPARVPLAPQNAPTIRESAAQSLPQPKPVPTPMPMRAPILAVTNSDKLINSDV